MTGAISNYLALCSDEVVNAARLKAYVDNGIVPSKFEIRATGCDGLTSILPCVDSEPPEGGYSLPELDGAPWYDPAAPESQNFAGLLVTSAVMSAPYARSVTNNIGVGGSLSRLKKQSRTLTVTGWLIGRTCCATQYGLRWLTAVLDDPPCGNARGCGGCDMDFLLCCPAVGSGVDDCLRVDSTVYVRPSEDDEYERGADFFRRMHDVGVIDGPNVLDCKGSSCGCGCGALLQVEFTLAIGDPYLYTIGEMELDAEPLPVCEDLDTCDVTWVLCEPGDEALSCPSGTDCATDPLDPSPMLPPLPQTSIPNGPGGIPLQAARLCVPVEPVKEWSSSTLNIEIMAGDTDLRNVQVKIYSNPQGLECDDELFEDDCNSCIAVLFSYVPAGGILRFSGERRTVTVECNGVVKSAFNTVRSVDGGSFDWPDLSCKNACVCIITDCLNVGEGGTISISRVDREL